MKNLKDTSSGIAGKFPVKNQANLSDRPTGDIDDSYNDYMESFSILSKEEEAVLAKRIEKGDKKAREELYNANLRLVVWVANRYKNLIKTKEDIAFMDLVQEGNIGLMKAVDKFDWRKENKFSTYATWWIRQSITRSLTDHSRTIRIPVHMVEKISKYKKAIKKMEAQDKINPSLEEIAEQMNLSTKEVLSIENALLQKPISIDKSISSENEGGKTFGDLIEDVEMISLDIQANSEIVKQDLMVRMSKYLKPQEIEILNLRFGLKDNLTRTLEEIAIIYDLTRERIRQIQETALSCLRDDPVTRQIIFETFGSDISDHMRRLQRVLVPTEAFIDGHRIISPYDYQKESLEAISKTRLRGINTALVVKAPGLGKTVTVAFDVKNFRKNNFDAKVLYLCHQNEILHQAYVTFSQVLKSSVGFGYLNGLNKRKNNSSCLFASFQTIKNHLSSFDKDSFDYIVVDEAHHAQAPTFKSVIEYFEPKFLLGLTATPDREDDLDIRNIFGDEIVNLSLPEALVKGWLCPIEYHVLTDNMNSKTLKNICSEVFEKGIRITKKQLNNRIFIEQHTKSQLKFIQGYTENGEKAIIFCKNIRHAKYVDKYLPSSVLVHSSKPGRLNSYALDAFRNGKVKHVIVVDKFNEGIDIPDVSIIVFLRSTGSKRIFFQQLGRGLRKSPSKDRVIVLDFVANIDRMIMMQDFVRDMEEIAKIENVSIDVDSPFHFKGKEFSFVFGDDLKNIISLLKHIEFDPYETWQEASKVCIEASVKNGLDFKRRYLVIDHKLPSNPNITYSNFPGWDIFLGKYISPDGWVTSSALSTETGSSEVTIMDWAEKYRSDHPEWFKMFWKKKLNTEHYHPELAKIIRDELIRKNNVPYGWITKTGLMMEGINTAKRTIKSFADKYRSDHPEWFKMFWSHSQNYVEHYHPELVRIIRKELGGRKHAPDGWITPNKLRSEISVTITTIKSFAEKYCDSNPEWFKMYVTHCYYIVHYHPELVRIIRKELVERKYAPEGWVTPNKLKSEFHASPATVKSFAEKYRDSNPEWFNNYLIGGTYTEYYHPKLVRIIRKELPKRKNKE